MSASSKIDPIAYISEHMPSAEASKSVASWYKTEHMELDFGDYVGRPSENITAHREALQPLLADGWYVTAVMSKSESGEWKRVTHSEKTGTDNTTETRNESVNGNESVEGTTTVDDRTTQHRNAKESSSTDEKASETNESLSTAKSSDSKKSITDTRNDTDNNSVTSTSGFSYAQNASNTWENSPGDSGSRSGGSTTFGSTNSNSETNAHSGTSFSGEVTAEGEGAIEGEESGKAKAESEATSRTEKDTEESADTEKNGKTEDRRATTTTRDTTGDTTQDRETEDKADVEETDPYWCAYQRIRLERRRMQSELVLQSMVDSLVNAYNEGRTINVERYDELVALYALMVNQTQDDAQAILDGSIDFGPLFDEIKRRIDEALRKYTDVADSLPEDWLESRREDVNLKFDNLIAEAQAKMITDGTYNGIVWPSVLAGIEHQRSHALDALMDESVKLKLSAYGDSAKIVASISSQLIDAETRIYDALEKRKIMPINLRNTVLKWMYEFMERRTDAHPRIEELVTVAQQLGYDGGVCAPN